MYVPATQILPAALEVLGMEALQEQSLSNGPHMPHHNAPLHLLLGILHTPDGQLLQSKGLLP